MNHKIEKATITIRDKEYSFLKPTAVDIIEIEDKNMDSSGSLNIVAYNKDLLSLVSRDLKADDFVKFNKQEIEMSNGETIILPEIGYERWAKEVVEIGAFSRAKLAKRALAATGLTGDISLAEFKYNDIDGLALAFFTMYDSEELQDVVKQINTFCL